MGSSAPSGEGLKAWCCHWEVVQTGPPGRSSAPCPGVLLEPRGGVEHVGSDAASESSGLHCSEKGENRERKNCWSMDELWGFLCIFWVCFAMLSPSVNKNTI